MNPLAVKIGRAKTEVITLPQRAVDRALSALAQSLKGFSNFPDAVDQFNANVIDEVYSWFPTPVVHKLNWLLGQIRLFGEARLCFLEVLLSQRLHSQYPNRTPLTCAFGVEQNPSQMHR